MCNKIKNSYKIFKKYCILIPVNIKVFFLKKNIIIFFSFFENKAIKLNIKVFIVFDNCYITVTNLPTTKKLKKHCVFLNVLQKNTFILLKKTIFDVSTFNKKKLKLIGIGFKANILDKILFKVLFLKLGYSHKVFIRIPKNLTVYCLKSTKLFIYGKNKKKLNEFVGLIRLCKLPDIYKGKGILYEKQKLFLKKGKKI